MRISTGNKMNTVRAATNVMIQIKWVLTSTFNSLLHCERKPFKACNTTSHRNRDSACNQVTEESPMYCLRFLSSALINTTILNYITDNFLIRKKSKMLIFILLLQRFKEKCSVQRPLIRINFLKEVIIFLFRYIMLHFWAILCNVWQGLPSLTSHWLSAS